GPTRDGYTFIGWDKAFDNVTGNITIMVCSQSSRIITEFRSRKLL
ncbi:MAG: hypothetical protein KH352_05600, partial [Ruminococcus sp.]|nr:hypothetical protein [Candidatus Apopatosoma intestinale]